MRGRPPDYIVVWRRRRGGALIAVVGVLGFVAGLVIGLNLLVSIVVGVAVAGLVAAVRARA